MTDCQQNCIHDMHTTIVLSNGTVKHVRWLNHNVSPMQLAFGFHHIITYKCDQPLMKVTIFR